LLLVLPLPLPPLLEDEEEKSTVIFCAADGPPGPVQMSV
jgi:hypothetical protein